MPVLILDNGASTIKAGITTPRDDSSSDTNVPIIVPNAIVRSKGDKQLYIGPDIKNCRDYFALHYRLPFDKGYLTDWDAEKAVWDRLFAEHDFQSDMTQTSLILTEPYFNLPSIQETYDQLIFEEYELDSYFRASPAAFAPNGDLFGEQSFPECALVVDSGFSFTHVVPIMLGSIQWSSVRRIDVGGKLLTNQLKDIVSYRHYNMMDQTYIINDIKEQCCYVSQNFAADLDVCQNSPKANSIVQEYVLPDFSSGRKGFVRPSAPDKVNPVEIDPSMPVLFMNNERFSVPELIFNPSDIGLNQAGLAETIAECISTLPRDLQGMFWANIGLVGGNVMFPGFESRLHNELRSLAPDDCEVALFKADYPITQVYTSALAFGSSPQLKKRVVTRAEYLEFGSEICRKRFSRELESGHEDSEVPARSIPIKRKQSKAKPDA